MATAKKAAKPRKRRSIMSMRSTDSTHGSTPIKVTREIPLWGLMSVAGAALIEAILIWSQLQSLSNTVTSLLTSQLQTTLKLEEISRSMNNGTLKDLEHDLKINSLTNRIAAIENTLPRGFNPAPGITVPTLPITPKGE